MKKNPVRVKGIARDWFAGLDLMDVGAAAGGLYLSSFVPGLVIKDTTTTMNKVLKIAVAAGSAAGAGMLLKMAKMPSAARFAVAGGLAGTLLQLITMTTGIQVGRPQMGAYRAPRVNAPVRRSIGESRYQPSSAMEPGVQVSVT